MVTNLQNFHCSKFWTKYLSFALHTLGHNHSSLKEICKLVYYQLLMVCVFMKRCWFAGNHWIDLNLFHVKNSACNSTFLFVIILYCNIVFTIPCVCDWHTTTNWWWWNWRRRWWWWLLSQDLRIFTKHKVFLSLLCFCLLQSRHHLATCQKMVIAKLLVRVVTLF